MHKRQNKRLHIFWTAAILISLLLVLFSLIFVSCAEERGAEEPELGGEAQQPDDAQPQDGGDASRNPEEPDAQSPSGTQDEPQPPEDGTEPQQPTLPDPDTPETPPPVQNSTRLAETEDMGQAYLDKFVFLGDSTTYGLGYYNIVHKTQVWTPASGTLMLDQWNYVAIVNPETGEEMMFTDLLSLVQPEYLMITLGVNGVSFMEESYFKESYTALVKKVQELSPSTTIVLNSIYPVTEDYEAKNNGINNLKISAANLWVEAVAAENGVHYLDSASALKNDKQVLPDEYTNGDGLHLNPTSFGLVVDYIRTHGC